MLHKEYLVIFFFNEVLGAFKFWDASFSTKKKKKIYGIQRLAHTLPQFFLGIIWRLEYFKWRIQV